MLIYLLGEVSMTYGDDVIMGDDNQNRIDGVNSNYVCVKH